MKLDELYSLRNSFTVIGLTGRIGSGCTKIAEMLSGDFETLKNEGLREKEEFSDKIFERKYSICKDYLGYEKNWSSFEVIRYGKVLMFYMLNKYGGEYGKIKELLIKHFKEDVKEKNHRIVTALMFAITEIDSKYTGLIHKIKSLPNFKEIRADDELKTLNDLFFGEDFNTLNKKIFEVLERHGYLRTRLLLHWVSCNIRSTGDPCSDSPSSADNIYSIAILINKLIKARKYINTTTNKPTKIVLDSLRNSLEIMFFKERYSAFYMVATKDVSLNSRQRIAKRLEDKISDIQERNRVVNKVIEIDETEYKTSDFSKGEFSSPDVENCIQKSDYHIFNLKKENLKQFIDGNPNGFYTREEQLMKLLALIQQPGIITPSSAERAMQIANTAKLNSGCISRKVGAVITDSNYYVKSVGWNDVAKGHTPCNLRSVVDFLGDPATLKGNDHYSKFEKGEASETSSYKYKGKKPGNFKDTLIDYFKDSYQANSKDLNGKNCSFCFKSIHNYYEGEANQVHTRSLHAEENAMLQMTKLGGTGEQGGFLFTTASPCELCSKKAYQLGISRIYYIDPYPGIAVDQILNGGQNQPKLVPFSGAIGNAYHQLYEPFLSPKDEITMALEIKPKKKLAKEFANVLNQTGSAELENFAKDSNLTDEDVSTLLVEAVKNFLLNKETNQS